MAVRTTISERDFPAILSNYDVGGYQNFRTFANGAGQTTLLLETDGGKYVLRYYENRTEQHVDFEVQLFAFLRDKRYPVPAILKSRTGQFAGTYRGKPYVLMELISGEHGRNPNDHFDAEQAASVVESVAGLHILTKEYRPQCFLNREAFDAAYCWRQFQKKHQDLTETEAGLWFKAELDSLTFPADMPRGLCHADLNFGNFLLRENEVVAVLDFDMSFYGPLIYDVASLIYWWAMPPADGLRVEVARFIIAEYGKHRPLSDSEKEHLIDALKLIVLLGISWGDRSEIDRERAKVELLASASRDIMKPPIVP
ncbi:Homoserine kinase [Devosia sp. LC5]|uniref:homoserine kinase n=1 Tax=Devosia sp. LC5 TaxID=1502724 RepID=UPI0004E2FB56|nr:homoserine kinase [Devosia sp. LC5]KFC62550.1 Homoserine kinase [Devosia sp. LC5]